MPKNQKQKTQRMFNSKNSFKLLTKILSRAATKNVSLPEIVGFVDNQFTRYPHFRYVPSSSHLLVQVTRHRQHDLHVLAYLLNNHVDPTDAGKYTNLELVARQKRWDSVRLFSQHPSVDTDKAYEVIQARCLPRPRETEISITNQNLLSNLSSIFNK